MTVKTFWPTTKFFFTSILPFIWPYVKDYLYLQFTAGRQPQPSVGQTSWFSNKLKTLLRQAGLAQVAGLRITQLTSTNSAAYSSRVPRAKAGGTIQL